MSDGSAEELEVPKRRAPLLLAAGAVVVVAAVVLAIVAFGGGEDSDQAATTTTRPAPPPPMLGPIELSDQPLWQADAMMTSVQIRDGVALLAGDDDLSLVDAATGVARWSFRSFFDDLPGGDGASWAPSHAVLRPGTPDGGASPRLVPHGDGLAVLVEYHWDSCRTDGCNGRDDLPTDESGLALLSAADGSVLWRTPTVPSVPAGEDRGPRVEADLWAADDHTALVTIATNGDNEGVRDLADLRTVAYDVATGSKRWEQTGLWPKAIAGDTVLGERALRPRYSAGPLSELADSTVAALDLGTGAPKWDLSERFARSHASLVVGDVALVVGGESTNVDDAVSEVVELDTGARLTEFGQAGRAFDCATDGHTLIACPGESGEDFALAVFDVAEREVTHSAGSLPQFFTESVWQDRVFITDGGDFQDYYTIDRAGNTIDSEVPGMPIEIVDGYAVFHVEDGTTERTEVYQLG